MDNHLSTPFWKTTLGRLFPTLMLITSLRSLLTLKEFQPPPLDVYQHNLRFQYEKGIDGIYRDVWYCDEMTAEEIKEKQDAVKAQWAVNNGYPSWVFDEKTCAFVPPIAHPGDGGLYQWNEATVSWQEALPTTKPE
jgi:hypothetical protein